MPALSATFGVRKYLTLVGILLIWARCGREMDGSGEVERFFRDLTDGRIRRGAFKGVPDRIGAISDYIDRHNQSPRLFVWKAKAETIIEKVCRARLALDKTPTA